MFLFNASNIETETHPLKQFKGFNQGKVKVSYVLSFYPPGQNIKNFLEKRMTWRLRRTSAINKDKKHLKYFLNVIFQVIVKINNLKIRYLIISEYLFHKIKEKLKMT